MSLLIFLLVFIQSVVANTETFLLVKGDTAFNQTQVLESINNYQYINYHSKQLENNYKIEKFNDEGLHQFSVDFQPNLFTKPADSQVRTIYIDLNELSTNKKYFIKVSWCAINPIDIDIHVTGESSNVLVIDAITDYYSIEPTAEHYLKDVKINLHLLENNQLFGLLTTELVQILTYVLTVLVGAVAVASFM